MPSFISCFTVVILNLLYSLFNFFSLSLHCTPVLLYATSTIPHAILSYTCLLHVHPSRREWNPPMPQISSSLNILTSLQMAAIDFWTNFYYRKCKRHHMKVPHARFLHPAWPTLAFFCLHCKKLVLCCVSTLLQSVSAMLAHFFASLNEV